jgi:hypothetical protein
LLDDAAVKTAVVLKYCSGPNRESCLDYGSMKDEFEAKPEWSAIAKISTIPYPLVFAKGSE